MPEATTHPQLPVHSLDEATPELRRPFTVNAVHWKIQTSFPKWDPRKSLIVPYIDVRLVVERLSAVVGGSWHEGRPAETFDGGVVPEVPPYLQLPSGALRAALTVCGVTRYDVGEAGGGFSREKALHSDALKRVGVKFGIGASLYAIPKIQFELEPEPLNEGPFVRREKGSKWNAKKQTREEVWQMLLKEEGLAELRRRYQEWLESDENSFGEPLDHGDAADAIGDVAETAEDVDLGEEAPAELSPQAASGASALTENLKGGKK